MTQIVLPDPGTPFGERVVTRLDTAQVIWLTTVGKDGTPQPNPVWFLKTDEGLLVYNRPDANRLTHVVDRPRVALHLDGKGDGTDIIVLTGTARRLENQSPAHEVPAYVAKYGTAMARVSDSAEKFGAAYPVPLLIEIGKVRGF
ncbi:MAG TPA: TIGR03667 family PPOX class F420-dependent oxidoreductase [Pseudonocardiaceae bacterium]|jgi:PPOX class probable F420-dependent enzyme|nr:TIGR03667 family PPOX class F420-dependent oxidoreductase [Pseudonocardiaceae bacterium]